MYKQETLGSVGLQATSITISGRDLLGDRHRQKGGLQASCFSSIRQDLSWNPEAESVDDYYRKRLEF